MTALTPEERQKKKDELAELYSIRSDSLHTVQQLLRAYSLYEKDIEYVIQDNKVMIVDEFTGQSTSRAGDTPKVFIRLLKLKKVFMWKKTLRPSQQSLCKTISDCIKNLRE